MEIEKKHWLKISTIIIVSILIFSAIISIFVIRRISLLEKDDGISAKECFALLMEIEKYQPYRNNLTFISSGSVPENGKSDYWFFYFLERITGTINFFYVNIQKNGSYIAFDNQTNYPEDTYITDWEWDSTDIVNQANELDCVKGFYKKHKSRDPFLGRIEFHSSYESQNGGCVIELNYGAGGGWGEGWYDMYVTMNGTSGEFIDMFISN